MRGFSSSPSSRPGLRVPRLAALWLAATVGFAEARVADTDLAHLTATADVIVLGTDRAVEEVDGKKVAHFAVERVLAGGHAASEVSYVAEGSWACDTAYAVPGERALLFLRRLPDRSPPLHAVHWAGRGRMPIREHDGRAWATVWTGNVRLPPDLPIAVGPDPGIGFIQDVALDPLISAVVVALWKHRAWRAAQVAAAALAVFALVRLAPWFVRHVRADLGRIRAQPPLARLARLAQVTWRTLLGVAAVFALWIAVGFTCADHAERAADAEWARVHQSSATLRSRFPETFPNSTALALDRLALRFGVDILWAPATPWPSPPFDWSDGVPPWRRWLLERLRDPQTGTKPAPAEAQGYRSDHRADLDRVVELLTGAQALEWGFHLDSSQHSSTLDTRGIPSLVHGLLFDAMELWHAGDRDGAVRTLEAVWAIAASLESSPNFDAELIEPHVVSALAVVLRKLDVPVSIWDAKLAALHPRATGLDVEHARAYEVSSRFRNVPLVILSEASTSQAADDLSSAALHLGFLAVTPLIRGQGAASSWSDAALTERLYGGPRCEPAPEPALDTVVDRPAWSLLVPGPAQLTRVMGPGPERLDITELHVDLTRRVLAARDHRARTGAWPTPDESATQTICQNRRWVYEPRPDGSLAISLDPPLLASTINGADRFPLAVELGSSG